MRHSAALTRRPKPQTFENCSFLKNGGYPCDLGYPHYMVRAYGWKYADGVKNLCKPCQQRLKEKGAARS